MGTPGKSQPLVPKAAVGVKRHRLQVPAGSSSAGVHQTTLLLPLKSALAARCVAAVSSHSGSLAEGPVACCCCSYRA